MRLLCCFAMIASVSALRGALRQSVGAVRRSVSRRALSNLAVDEERFCLAPMMEYTDRHFRKLFRGMSRNATLYTEMITATALVDERGERRAELGDEKLRRFLQHDDALALGGADRTVLQLGGASPVQLAGAARLAREFGYSGINLNCGCPSERVASAGCFGAALMSDASLVAECCAAIAEGGGVPVSVKCRIGTAPRVSEVEHVKYETLRDFVKTVATEGGVSRFQVHARVAVLGGLSPDANRKVPPLRPELVAQLASEFPDLRFVFNGQVDSYEAAFDRLALHEGVVGVMVGRDTCRRPWYWASTDSKLYGAPSDAVASRRVLLAEYAQYGLEIERLAAETVTKNDHFPRRALIKPALNLFHGEPGSNAYKRECDALARDKSIGFDEFLHRALARLPDDVLDSPPR